MEDKVRDGNSSIVVIVVIVAALCSKFTTDCQQSCCWGGCCENVLAAFITLLVVPGVLVRVKRWLMVIQEGAAEEEVEWRQKVVEGEDL